MKALLAAFSGPEPLTEAARRAKGSGRSPLEAFTPYPLPEISKLLGTHRTGVPWWMLGGGFLTAAVFFFMEWLSATRLYPFDQGGRPFNSWPAFFVATVEISVLMAALTGFVTLLVKSGLPRLHQPIFEHRGFERASQDQFLLALPRPEEAHDRDHDRRFLFDAGALWVEEVEL